MVTPTCRRPPYSRRVVELLARCLANFSVSTLHFCKRDCYSINVDVQSSAIFLIFFFSFLKSEIHNYVLQLCWFIEVC